MGERSRFIKGNGSDDVALGDEGLTDCGLWLRVVDDVELLIEVVFLLGEEDELLFAEIGLIILNNLGEDFALLDL